MISTDITNKNTSKAKGGNDTPVGLALYLLYGLSNDPKVELNRVKYKGSINCATSDLIQSAEEIQYLNELKNRKHAVPQRYTEHIQVSLRPGEHLDENAWSDVVIQHLKALGLEDHKACFVVHKDTDNEHCHIFVSRVHPKNLRVNHLSYSHKKMQKLDAKLEKQYDLQLDNHGNENEIADRQGFNNAQNIEHITGQQTLYSYVDSFRQDLLNAKSWDELHRICKEHNVECKKSGRGIIFTTEDPERNRNVYIKGSAFGKTPETSLSLFHLEQRLGSYTEPKLEDDIIIKQRYEAKPSNFLDDLPIPDLNYARTLSDLFDLYKRQKMESKAQKQKYLAKQQALYQEYRQKKAKLRKDYNRDYRNYQKLFHGSELDLKLAKLEADYHSAQATLRQNYEKQKLALKQGQLPIYQNFMDFLKRNPCKDPKVLNVQKHLLLMTRKLSRQQEGVNRMNYIPKLDLSGGMTAVVMRYMYPIKTTSKGQDLYISKQQGFSDFIKDDCSKLITCDHPNVSTIKDMLLLAQSKTSEPIEVHGLSGFQQDCLELALQNHVLVRLTDENLNQHYEERLNERRRNADSTRAYRRYSSEFRKFRESGKFKPRRARKPRAFFQWRVDNTESESNTNNINNASANTSNLAPSSNANQFSNTQQNHLESQPGRFTENRSPTKTTSNSLHHLSELDVATNTEKNSVLLSPDQRSQLGIHDQREVLQGVRWSVHRAGSGQGGAGVTDSSSTLDLAKNENYQELEKVFDTLTKEPSATQELTEAQLAKLDKIDEYLSHHPELENYLEERNLKHAQGFKDVLEHKLFEATSEKQEFTYLGYRNLDDKQFALLKPNHQDVVYLKEVASEYQLHRFKDLKKGSVLTISENKVIFPSKQQKNSKGHTKQNSKPYHKEN